jgi:ABC-type glycerol-3-phosphate transport system permease component
MSSTTVTRRGATQQGTRRRRTTLSQQTLNVFLYAVMIICGLAFALPLLWMIGSSLKEEANVLSTPPTLFPLQPQWSNYAEVFAVIPRFFYNSVKLAIINVVGVLAVSALAGFAFGRLRFPGRNILFVGLLATAMIPGIAYLIPQYIIFQRIGWVDTQIQYFMSLPQELEDAARVDGAGSFTVFWRILLPETKPALGAIAIFTFLDSWNDLFGPLIYINSRELQTLPVALAQFQSEYFSQITLLMAGATIAVMPVIIVYLIAQRQFIQGITLTGINR